MAPTSRLPHPSRSPANLGSLAAPVYIVAPEQDLRAALARNLRSLGVEVRIFGDLPSYAIALPELEPGCLLLDSDMLSPAGGSSPHDYAWRKAGWPMIMMFRRLDAEDAVRAIRLGASDLLCKPVSQDELLEALRRAAPKLGEQRLYDASIRAREAIDGLTPREREIVAALKQGLSNKKIARELGLSHRTVEMHRHNIHRKLGVSSMAELLRIAWLAHDPGEEKDPASPAG